MCYDAHYATPGTRIFLEKLIVAQLAKKFSTFYETLRFITVFTAAYN
jgi:hypothetical protein